MASWYPDLATATRAAIVAAWPEVAGNGIFHELELAQTPFFIEAENGDLPCAAFGFTLAGSGEWGADADTDEGELRIYYITTLVEMDALVAKLETMRTQLRNNSLTCGQIIGFPTIDFSLDLVTNSFFLNNQRPNRSGCVKARLVVGEI